MVALTVFRDVGGWAACGGLGFYILFAYKRGTIATRRSVIDMRNDYEDRIAELLKVSEARIVEAIDREKYSRGTADIMLKANTELLRQNGLLAGELKVAGNVISARLSGGVNGRD